MALKIDLHSHTKDSRDAFGTLEEVSRWAAHKGVDAVVVTNHEVQSLVRQVRVNSVAFIPGIELYTKYGHILGINLQGPMKWELRKVDPIEAVHEAGGFAAIAHPFELGARAKTKGVIPGLDAVEVINSSYNLFDMSVGKAREYALKLGLPQTAGSDSHMPGTIGDAYVEVEAPDVEEALAMILKGQGIPRGRPTPLVDKIRLNALRALRGKLPGPSRGFSGAKIRSRTP